MQCPRCQHENPEGMKFCIQCGSSLKNRCANCGFENLPQAKFCGECGAKLVEMASISPTEPTDTHLREHEDIQQDAEILTEPLTTEPGAPGAERRQLTVMFCDLVGSTPLSEQLDPEELRDVLHDYQSGCAKVIRGYDGHIARYFGDGILVYFGYPVAHEDDAQRAVRAGLGIVEGIKQLNARLQQERNVKLELRLGIHTGVVVAGDMDQNEQLESMAVVGETPNVADRLQKLAEPDTLVISSATYQLIEGFFDCRSLGFHSLEGISHLVEVYQVLHESGAKTRLDTGELKGLTPLVGREQELSLLLDRWEQVKEGMGHVVLLGGEAGIGKSRMVKVMKERIAEEPQSWLTECRCSPYHQNTVLHPVVELFERIILQFDRDDSPAEKLNKVEAFLVRYGFPLDETVPLFAIFLSIPLGDNYSPLNMTPKQQKERTIHTLIDILIQRASHQPVLFVAEDLHWADASSLELLDLLIERGPVSGLLTLFTFRPAFTPPWTGRSHLTYVTLNRLTPRQVSDMVKHIAIKPLPDEVMEQIVGKTDGVPLFVEELTRMVLESGLLHEQADRFELTGPLPPLAIPSTLQDSLMARLDRLSAVKEVAQLGSVIGREFPYEMLQSVSPLDDEALEKALSQLVDAELLYQRGLPPQSTYLFKHALIRDVSYESLLRSRRQQYHHQIAQAFQERFPEIAEAQPEIVAHHYTGAGLSEQAIPYWQKAGQQAVQRSAHVEAINHLKQGLELLENLPETSERISQELTMQITLGRALIATKGYGNTETGASFTRARKLCQQLGEIPQLFPALWGLFMFYFLRAEMKMAYEQAERLITAAQKSQKQVFLVEAHVDTGEALCEMGEFASALEQFRHALSFCDLQQDHSFPILFVRDSRMQCMGYMGWTMFYLGYLDSAVEKINESLTLARRLDHPYSLGIALGISVTIQYQLGNIDTLQKQLRTMLPLGRENAFPFVLSWGIILSGWMQVQQGIVEEGLAKMREGLAILRTTGSEVYMTFHYTILARALLEAGKVEEGLTVVDETLTMVNEHGNRTHESELYRLRGELMLRKGADDTEVETHFQRARYIANRQHAKPFELRAVISLSRLWRRQGKAGEAKKMLQEVYDWFTEGFDTRDLKEAKALLEELS